MRGMSWLTGLVLALLPAMASAAAPDLSGRWLPVPARSTPWPDPLPLTDAARARLAAFDADRDEPAGFCMPLGTPRNTLSGTSPLEVLQTEDRVYFVFQPNLLSVETRRVYLDERPLPPEAQRVPTWLGTSRGRFEGSTLVAETTGLEPQAILDGRGLSQSGGLVVRERWQVRRDSEFGRVLVDEIELWDAATFTKPVRLQRVFAWAPTAQLREGQCSERLWIDTLWRYRLREHAEQARAGKPREEPDRVRGSAGDAK
jgi:hypothetical protein